MRAGHAYAMAGLGLLMALWGPSQTANAEEASVAIVSTETASRTVEDGGTGPFPSVMVTDSTRVTHTVFRPMKVGGFGKDIRLPIIAWGNGACVNPPWEHVNFLSEVASHGFWVIAIGPCHRKASEVATDLPLRN